MAEYDKIILDGTNLQLFRGKLIGILGKNGCGKTTFLRCITGYKDCSGKITYENSDFKEMNIKEKAVRISMLTQQTDIIEGITVKEVIKLGKSPYGEKTKGMSSDIAEICDVLEIGEIMNRDYSCLSQGQKQLVNIARVVVQNTPVILLDEPDSYLDFDNKHKVMSLFRQLAMTQNKAILTVVHNPVMALTYCHTVVGFLRGKKIFEINPEKDNLNKINTAINQLYRNITIRRDCETGEFYYILNDHKK